MSNAINGAMLMPGPSMVQMFPSGNYLDLLDPDPTKIELGDIAHHTGMTVRYGGGVRQFYSVAEHAVLVANLLAWQGKSAEIVRAGLLHDAAEAYVGDLIAPLKWSLRAVEYGTFAGDNGEWFIPPPKNLRGLYSLLSGAVDVAIGERFGVDHELFDHPDVKTADMWALKIEAAELTFNGGKDWRYPGHIPNNGELPAGVVWDQGLAPAIAAAMWLTEARGMGLR